MRYRYLLFFTLLTFSAAAQSRIRNGLIFGGVGAQVDGDRMSGYHKAGITGGLSSTVQVSDRWNVRLEVTYMQKGARSRSSADSLAALYPDLTAIANQTPAQQQAYLAQFYQQQPDFWLRYRLNYVQMPVFVEYRATPKVTLYSGLSVDYLLRATADYGYGYGPPLGVQFRKTDLMGHAGVDLSIGERWSVTMRLMYSLRDISTSSLAPDKYFFFATGRLGGYRNNLLSTTLRFYLGDAPKFRGTPLFRKRDDSAAPPAAEPNTDGEPTN